VRNYPGSVAREKQSLEKRCHSTWPIALRGSDDIAKTRKKKKTKGMDSVKAIRIFLSLFLHKFPLDASEVGFNVLQGPFLSKLKWLEHTGERPILLNHVHAVFLSSVSFFQEAL